MVPSTTAADDWAMSRVFALPEMWARFVKHGDGLVAAWRLMRVCKAAREGIRESTWLKSLPGLVVCGGFDGNMFTSKAVWRLSLATMRWERMPPLVTARRNPICCVVRGTIVVLGGRAPARGGENILSGVDSVEVLSEEEGAFIELPPLSLGRIESAAAIAVEESESAKGQVLLLGGWRDGGASREVHVVDLAAGTCTRQPDMRTWRCGFAAARLKDRRVVCAGDGFASAGATTEVYGPPAPQDASDGPWTWTDLPEMSTGGNVSCGCVLSDGRFAVFGRFITAVGHYMPSCEALTVGADGADGADGAQWESLAPMHEARYNFTCAAVAGCVIVVGGRVNSKSVEVYDEVLDRWFRLPRDYLPHDGAELFAMGSALL